ncbi:hypothetical protein DF19_36670 [Streptomyces olindensis]|nr:hypothetical protein DF19_36670 [Streptomyces olindensis]
MSATGMLSSMIQWAPTSRASTACVTVCTSTSLSTVCPARAIPRLTASIAAVTQPAAAMWFSLSRTIAARSRRWLWPPPAVTAYLSRARRPGAVLRVSRMRALVPATAWT